MTETTRPLLPEPPGQAKWREAAISYDIDQLKNLRDSATKWSASITALLGLFATVAVVAGTDKLSSISNEFVKWLVFALVIASGVSAAYAIVRANMAAGAGAKVGDSLSNLSADSYRGWVDDASKDSATNLGKARWWGYLAVLGVFAIGVLGLLSAALPASPGSASSVVVVYQGGGIACGPIASVTNDDGKTNVTVGGQPMAGPVLQVVPVTKC